MALTIGARLPEPYFSRVLDKATSTSAVRICEDCGYTFTTAEIPLVLDWLGTLATCCPADYSRGIVLDSDDITRLRSQRVIRRFHLDIISMGGMRRRYHCRNTWWNVPEQKWEGCLQYNGKPTRWTTIEVMSDGTVAMDITLCIRCGGRCRRQRVGEKTKAATSVTALEIAQRMGRVTDEKAKALFAERARARRERHLLWMKNTLRQGYLFGLTGDYPRKRNSDSHPRSARPTGPADAVAPTIPPAPDDPMSESGT